jgi:pimeloyl-ACP methyl ester carboxylesterase
MSGIYKSAHGARAVEAQYQRLLGNWPVANQQLRVPTREGDTFIVASGPERAPPLLLLHGAGANAAMWMNDIVAWAAHFRVYAVDMIGEPGLSAPTRPPLASEAYALWLDDVTAALLLARVSIVGVSLGGWLAIDYATRRPQCVDRIALLCPSGVGHQKVGFLFKALPLLMLGRWGRRKALELVAGPEPADASAAERAFAEFVLLIFEHFRPRVVKVPVFSDEALQRLTMPVLAIVGGNDVFLDSADTKRRLQRVVPHAEVRYLPEAGHVLRDQSAVILEFLRRAGEA